MIDLLEKLNRETIRSNPIQKIAQTSESLEYSLKLYFSWRFPNCDIKVKVLGANTIMVDIKKILENNYTEKEFLRNFIFLQDVGIPNKLDHFDAWSMKGKELSYICTMESIELYHEQE